MDDDSSNIEGYLILVDIKNSTSRKINLKKNLEKNFEEKWVTDTKDMYKSFSDMIDTLKKDFQNNKFEIIVKFIGDMAMSFIRILDSYSQINVISEKILDRIIGFIEHNDKKGLDENDKLDNIKLKIIVTYLDGINKMINPQNLCYICETTKDVLGRGVDFSFRLEKFSDFSHITMNRAFESSI